MLIFYKVSQVVIILLFAFFVSDLRKKNQTKELLNHKLIIVMKIVYIIPLAIFLYSVITTEALLVTDFISFLLTLIGLVVVILAKSSLGINHSWTGYGTFPKSICKKGIFSIIRHPMYTGIFMCILGMWFHVISHQNVLLIIINLISSFFILFVLTSSAIKEEQHLSSLFGEDYEEYERCVPRFFPIKITKKDLE